MNEKQLEIVHSLIELGYPDDVVNEAVSQEHIDCVDMAVAWILENFQSEDSEGEEAEDGEEEEKQYKMVMVVRNDLKMKKGKIAAQCCHACLGIYRASYDSHRDIFDEWLESGSAKVVCKADSIGAIYLLKQHAHERNIPSYLVHDAGKTQIPAGSATVLALGPGLVDDIDEICGGLKLL